MCSGFLIVTYPTPTTTSWGRYITNRIGPLHNQDSLFKESGSDGDRSPNVARTLLLKSPDPSRSRVGAAMSLSTRHLPIVHTPEGDHVGTHKSTLGAFPMGSGP